MERFYQQNFKKFKTRWRILNRSEFDEDTETPNQRVRVENCKGIGQV